MVTSSSGHGYASDYILPPCEYPKPDDARRESVIVLDALIAVEYR